MIMILAVGMIVVDAYQTIQNLYMSYHISINQLIRFSTATDNSKNTIIGQQINPNPLLIPWYQAAKGGMKRYMRNINDNSPIHDTIIKVQQKKTEGNKRKEIDKKVSIEALQLFLNLRWPSILSASPYSTVRLDKKTVNINGVDVSISPDVIIKIERDDSVEYGAIKLYLSKSAKLDLSQCNTVSSLLYKYLSTELHNKGVIINPQLCLCVDVFRERIVATPSNYQDFIDNADTVCSEIRFIWDRIAA